MSEYRGRPGSASQSRSSMGCPSSRRPAESGANCADNRDGRDDWRCRPPTARRVRQRPERVGGVWVGGDRV